MLANSPVNVTPTHNIMISERKHSTDVQGYRDGAGIKHTENRIIIYGVVFTAHMFLSAAYPQTLCACMCHHHVTILSQV